MKTYESMKSSNVLWLGDIPEHWELKRNIAILAERNELSEQGEEQLLSLSQYTGITIRGKNAVKMGMHEAESLVGYKIVHENDIVMNIMLAWNGSTAKSQYNGIISPAYAVYHLIDNSVNPDYLHYLYKIPNFMQYFEAYSTGLIKSRLRLYPQSFLHLSTIVPPREEQDRIVRFLDWKVSEINRLIHCRKRQIERLEELKKCKITKTLHGNKIWLKHLLLCPLQYGANSSGTDFAPDLPRYVRITDIDANGKLKLENAKSISFAESTPYILESEDILLARSGATVGKAFMYKSDYGCCAFAGYLIRAKLNTNIILPKYFIYFTNSLEYDNWKNSIFIQATIQNISAERYGKLSVPVPSIEEQQKIVAYLDEQLKKIDSAIANKQKQIETLQELKTRLISDVVTGKIDVRGIEIPEYEYTAEEADTDSEAEAEELDEGGEEI